MTRWWDTKEQVNRSLQIQLLLRVYCSAMHTNSTQTNDATGNTLADASTQWCPNGNPVVICIMRTPLVPQIHWDATGTTLADARTRWCPSCNTGVICIIGTHWNTTTRPHGAHGKHTGYKQFLQWHYSVYWGLNSGHIGLPLDCHWITTGSG